MKYFFEAGVGSIPVFSMAETAVKASGTGARRPVDLGFARTGTEWRLSQQAGLSCYESPACRRADSKKIVQNLEELSIDFVRFLE